MADEQNKILASDRTAMGRCLADLSSAVLKANDVIKKWDRKLTSEMKGIWEGDSYDAFIRKYQEGGGWGWGSSEDMLRNLDAMHDLTVRLLSVIEDYMKMEQEIEGIGIVRRTS